MGTTYNGSCIGCDSKAPRDLAVWQVSHNGREYDSIYLVHEGACVQSLLAGNQYGIVWVRTFGEILPAIEADKVRSRMQIEAAKARRLTEPESKYEGPDESGFFGFHD